MFAQPAGHSDTDQRMANFERPVTGADRTLDAFTLLELLIVLVILGFVLALTPVFLSSGRPVAELQSAAREIAAAVRIAQSEAIKQNREVVFVLDVDARQYSVGKNLRQGEVSRHLMLKLFTAQSERLDKARAGIRFFPDGSSTGGKITISNDTRSFRIAVNWLTGKVAILE